MEQIEKIEQIEQIHHDAVWAAQFRPQRIREDTQTTHHKDLHTFDEKFRLRLNNLLYFCGCVVAKYEKNNTFSNWYISVNPFHYWNWCTVSKKRKKKKKRER